MPLHLYDSMTRELRELKPAHPDGVFRFYNCGLTVYAAGHIGNFRTFLVNDVIRRLLELDFPGKVRHVRNLTDVDDKTIKRARDEGRPLADVTRQWTEKFHADCLALNCLPPNAEPRATDPQHLREQVDMIECLMRKGNAYRVPDGSVYFKVSSFPAYGALSRLKERELQPGDALKAHAADADEKEDGSDFALWKAWKPDDGPNKWAGPAGAAEGRPGWHIECSAMSKAILGDTIDLHTGGVDLLFPHHENEIAQSECCNGQPLSRHWYHSEHLLVDGKKMSKSLGNFYTLGDLVEKNYSPLVVRYALLNGHPRKQLNFVFESLHASWAALDRLQHFDEQIQIRRSQEPPELARRFQGEWGPFKPAFDSLCDDLNVPEALGHIFSALNRSIDKFSAEQATMAAIAFRQICSVLGLEFWKWPRAAISVPPEINALAQKRWAAKQARDFKAADVLRAELTAAGWSMLDSKDGYKLAPLVAR
jgi:cysteinyl-tRNA synthetase